MSKIRKLSQNYESRIASYSKGLIIQNRFAKYELWFKYSEISLGKPIDSYWFKMPGLTCLVFSCVYCFFLKRWNYIKIFVLHEYAVLLSKFFSCRLTSWTSQKYNRSFIILLRTLLWIFGKWNCKKRSFSGSYAKYWKDFYIVFTNIIHTDYRSNSLEPSTLKRLHWIIFLMKIAYLWTAFTLHL